METPPTPDLLWIDPPVGTCVLAGGAVVGREATLELVGTGDPPERVVLGWSEAAGCWYAAFETLVTWCEDADVSPAEAGPFVVDGTPRRAAVHFVESGVTIPWEAFAARVGSFTDAARAEAPSAELVAALPELPEPWELGAFLSGPVRTDEGLVEMTVAVVVDGGGRPRGVRLLEDASDDALAALVQTAAARPLGDVVTAARPSALLVADADLAGRLAAALQPAGIAVRHAPTPGADVVLDALASEAMGGAPRSLDPLFADATDDDLRAFLAAAGAFYDADPWRRLRGDSFVAVQDLDDGAPWRYASVMGQMEDTPGLGLFASWLDVCTLVHGGAGAVLQTGAPLESVTRLPLDVLDPAEAERLSALGARPDADGEVPVVTRYADGDMVASALPLPVVTAMLTGLREAVAARRAKTITSITATAEAGGVRLALRYPARGDEALGPSAGGVRVTVEGAPGRSAFSALLGGADEIDDPFSALRPNQRLTIEGPAGTSAYALGKAVRQAFDARGRWGSVMALVLDGRTVWTGRARATDPGPTLDDLVGREVHVVMASQPYAARVERMPTAAELRAEVTDEA